MVLDLLKDKLLFHLQYDQDIQYTLHLKNKHHLVLGVQELRGNPEAQPLKRLPVKKHKNNSSLFRFGLL